MSDSLVNLALNALLRPLKEKIWPGYTEFLDPDYNCNAQGYLMTQPRQQHFVDNVTSYAKNSHPAHPDSIIRLLEDFVLYAGEPLNKAFNSANLDRNTPFYVNPVAEILNRRLGTLVMFAVSYWCTVWSTSLKFSLPQSTRSEPLDQLLDYGRRTGQYTYTGDATFTDNYGGTHAGRFHLKNALDALVKEVKVALQSSETKIIYANIMRLKPSDIAGCLSRTAVSCVASFHNRFKFYPVSAVYGPLVRSLRTFVDLYVCRADPTSACDCPDFFAHTCNMNQARPYLNEAVCGNLRWQPALNAYEKDQAYACSYTRPAITRTTTCEFCMLDALTSGGQVRDWSIVQLNTALKCWYPTGSYCKTQFRPTAWTGEQQQALLKEPLATIAPYYKFHAPREPSELFANEELESDMDEEYFTEADLDNLLVIDEEEDWDVTSPELEEELMGPLVDLPHPLLCEIFALD